MKLAPSLALLPLVLSAPMSGDPEHGLAIELRSPSAEVELGESIVLRLAFVNSGEEAFYVERPKDLGPQHLSIRVQRGACVRESPPLHYDAEVESLRLMFVPLLHGDRLEGDLAAFNAPGLLNLTDPGEYSVRATFVSEGLRHLGLLWPVWRGRVDSGDLRLIVKPPEESTLEAWRDRLRRCLAQVPCEDWKAVAYFRLVRDRQAREVLERLFDRDYEVNPMIAEALAHQLEPSESEVIRRIAERSRYVELRDTYLAIAERVRTRGQDPCAE